jgi:diacylglycerol kinase family enzyme
MPRINPHRPGKAEPDAPSDTDVPLSAPGPHAQRWRLGIISNPMSGSNRGARFATFRRYIAHHPHLPHRIVTNADDVIRVLDDFARRDINVVAVNAGDGTVQALLTALFHHRPYQTLPLLALLCGGTTNMTAKDLGFRGSRIDSIARILDWSQTGRGVINIVRRPILRVRQPNGHPPQYGLFWGAASIFKGINLFHARIHGTGLKGNPANAIIVARFLVAIAARNLDRLGSARATITVDGRCLGTRSCLLIVAHTLEQLIFGLRPHWGTEEGALRLTAVDSANRFFLRVMAAICQGRRSRLATAENGFHSHNAKEIRVALDGGFALDGELFQADSRQGELVLDAGGQAAFLRSNP